MGMLWSECFLSPNLYVGILMPSVMVPGGGAFGGCLGHKGGALGNGFIVLLKKTHRAP